MNLVNLTSETINLIPEGLNGPIITIPPSGQVARSSTTYQEAKSKRKVINMIEVDGTQIPVLKPYMEIEGIPDPVENTIYIVHAMVTLRINRSDVVSVYEPIKNLKGEIIGYKSLGCGPSVEDLKV
ncbi:hypothetical protein [Paenibacillus agilis]|uniref:Uncharacterized protein n=1 Tax=Paenibacillus agilis TaxID=3020863 RepID=A0A559ID41_9BACL|nr:hypothetical protein [Paenibacillus agilis]TVX85591.1 hypothetical protein FPZ44_24865 [Paenibacillus agilis]